MADALDPQEPVPRPDYGDDGVDLTLIRLILVLTPAERLDLLKSAWPRWQPFAF